MGPIQAPAWRKVPESFDTGEERIPKKWTRKGVQCSSKPKDRDFRDQRDFL